MKIALGQFSATKKPAENLKVIERYAQSAAQQGAAAVVFPEASMLAFGGRLHQDVVAAGSLWVDGLKKVAAQCGITVLAGGFSPEPGADAQAPRVFNELQVVSPQGRVETYRKIHLYDAFGFRESDGVVAGEEPLVVDIDGVKVGLATCYDVRFPKLFAQLSRAGAKVCCVVASWAGGPGKIQQWQLLTGARALDSNMFVVAVDQADPRTCPEGEKIDITGPYGVGFSRVVSPFGEVVAELGAAPELLTVDLDVRECEKARQALPVLENAKLGY